MPYKSAKPPRKRRRLTQPSANRGAPSAKRCRPIMEVEMRILPPNEEKRYHTISTLAHLQETGALGTLQRLDTKELLIDVDRINEEEGDEFPLFEEKNRAPVTSLLPVHQTSDATATGLPTEVEPAELQEPYVPHSCPPQMIMDYQHFALLLSQMTLRGPTRL